MSLVSFHLCPPVAGLKRTPGQMDQSDSSKVSRDEVHHPPRCCCSKSLKFPDLIILMNLFKAANALDAKKTFLARNEVEAADGQEVKKTNLTNQNHPILSYLISRLPSRLQTTLRTTLTRPSAAGGSRCPPTRRCTSGARPLTFSRAISSA